MNFILDNKYLMLFFSFSVTFALPKRLFCLDHTHARTHTGKIFCPLIGPTCLRCVDWHFVGVRAHSVLALCSQLEGIGGEGLQVLQQVGCAGLKAHFLLRNTETERDWKMSEKSSRIIQESRGRLKALLKGPFGLNLRFRSIQLLIYQS